MGKDGLGITFARYCKQDQQQEYSCPHCDNVMRNNNALEEIMIYLNTFQNTE